MGKGSEGTVRSLLGSATLVLLLLMSSCGFVTYGTFIDVTITNGGGVDMGRTTVWFEPGSSIGIGRRPAGTSFTHVQFVAPEFNRVRVESESQEGEKLLREFVIDFVGEIEDPHLELEFIIDHEANTIVLQILSILKGGTVKELATIEGEEPAT